MPDAPALPQASPDSAPNAAQRVARTGGQAGAAGFTVVIVCWLLRLVGLDLDPGVGKDMPSEVVAAFTGLLTVATAVWMNRPAKQPPQPLPPAAQPTPTTPDPGAARRRP